MVVRVYYPIAAVTVLRQLLRVSEERVLRQLFKVRHGSRELVVGSLVAREHYLRLLLAAVHAHSSDHVAIRLATGGKGSSWEMTSSTEVALGLSSDRV